MEDKEKPWCFWQTCPIARVTTLEPLLIQRVSPKENGELLSFGVGFIAQETVTQLVLDVESTTHMCPACQEQMIVKCVKDFEFPPVLRIPVPRQFGEATEQHPFILKGDLDAIHTLTVTTKGQALITARYKLIALTLKNKAHHWGHYNLQERWYNYNDIADNGRLQLMQHHTDYSTRIASMLYLCKI
jgi:hypothetical protein